MAFTPSFLVLGHVTLDLTEEGFRLGGTAAYAALAAQALGEAAAVVTSAGPELDLAALLPGIAVAVAPAAATTTFRNIYPGGQRRQFLYAQAALLGPACVPKAWRQAPVVLLGPVAQEVEPAVAELFDKKASLVGVSPQGWLRRWDREGRVRPAPWRGCREVLRRARALIISEEDITHRPVLEEAWARQVEVVVVTCGERGARVHWRGEVRSAPAFAAQVVDPTGAGDVFAAAFLIHFWRAGDPWEAADFAQCAASFATEAQGTRGIPTQAQIEARLRQGQRRSPLH